MEAQAMNQPTSDLVNWDEVFVIVAGDDVYPALSTNTLHVWSDENEAIDFVADKSFEGVHVGAIDCPAGLLELLSDLEGEGCDGLSVDGDPLSLTDAIHSLQSVTS
jgi:hypothetical protein